MTSPFALIYIGLFLATSCTATSSPLLLEIPLHDFSEALYVNKKLEFDNLILPALLNFNETLSSLADHQNSSVEIKILKAICEQHNPAVLLQKIDEHFLNTGDDSFVDLKLTQANYRYQDYKDFQGELLDAAEQLLSAEIACKSYLKGGVSGQQDEKRAKTYFDNIVGKLKKGMKEQKDNYWPNHIHRDAQRGLTNSIQMGTTLQEAAENVFRSINDLNGDEERNLNFAIVMYTRSTNSTQWSEPVAFQAGTDASNVVSFEVDDNRNAHVYRSQSLEETFNAINQNRVKFFGDVSQVLSDFLESSCLPDATKVTSLYSEAFQRVSSLHPYPFLFMVAKCVRNDPNWVALDQENFNGAAFTFDFSAKMCSDPESRLPVFFNVFVAF
ncbi:hypothetical protein QR680_009858 [Steinernema hermaphroditum]|uniref:VWFA domain-containing protein n=1 Tax=Steinernema hermaphroditum TaxID=289476 RepID=A0AA39INK1_9BILA|nr:hypothetical protein QR680_009858 [Steinernema hermaphroditum]